MDQHDVVARLKALRAELGRPPTRLDVESNGFFYQLQRNFGGMTVALQAAGIETYAERRRGGETRKIDNSVFEVDIEAHLAKYEPREIQPPGPYPTAAIISDIHWPFSKQRVTDAFIAHVERRKPQWVIINGDAWDMYSHAKFPRSHNIFTPREEQQAARRMNAEFWEAIRKASPASTCVQMMGNHDVRPLKRILEAYPAAEDWIEEKLKELFTFDGVKTIMDPRDELHLREDIIVFHGYRTRLGGHRDYTLMSCFNGHTHRGGCVWRAARNWPLFECNSGVAGDPEAKGLTYTAQRYTDWTPGFAAMDEEGPRFVPA